MRQNGYQNMNSGNKQVQQPQHLNYQYDNRYINENENSYIEMPRNEQRFEMPLQQQQNGFYNQRRRL